MMLGYLLARAGIQVVVLEKHRDFLRDFRGDTIHPSTLEVMYELGLLDDFLARPHEEVTQLSGFISGTQVPIADFTHVPTHCKFLAFMPQWDFLDFLAASARSIPTFDLRMNCEAISLIRDGDRVAGVLAATPDGEVEIRAQLTVGADGRHSIVREQAGLEVEELGAPMDVLWMRLSRSPDDPHQVFGYIERGRIFIMIDRNTYWQCGFVIPKGSFDSIQQGGIAAFQGMIAQCAPFVRDRVGEVDSWDKVSLLTVQVDRLKQWYRDGLLCIGDAAHAMSPVGGVGINLAIQDAVAAANILYPAFGRGSIVKHDLEALQRRRTFPTKMTQALQIFIQKNVITNVLKGNAARSSGPPPALLLLKRFPVLQRIPAYVIGIGFRPEHVRTPLFRYSPGG
jgi:2-polyprenyl-6-methoxyphenol hydroxylase-like FAD-dependent oxidoreductase